MNSSRQWFTSLSLVVVIGLVAALVYLRLVTQEQDVELERFRLLQLKSRNEAESLRSKINKAQDEIALLKSAGESNEARLAELQGQLNKRTKSLVKAEGASKKATLGPADIRPDTPAEQRLLDYLRERMEAAEFVQWQQLSKKEQQLYATLKGRSALVRGPGNLMGLYALRAGIGGVAPLPDELQPWLRAYAAVDTEMRNERQRVVDELARDPQLQRFESKQDILEYEQRQRETYQQQHGRRHSGWHYRQVDDRWVLVNREDVDAHADLQELQQLRDEVATRLNDREGGDAGVMSKWTGS